MASSPNMYGPQEISGPFIQDLTQPARQSTQQFSGYGGKLGTAAGLVSKFLAGAAEGRMRQAQKIENDKALKFSAIARYAQQIENDQTLTPEARAQKSQTILKLLGEQVLGSHGGDGKDGKKGDQKDGHPILGMIKHVAEGFVGGPLPKKYEGPSSDDLLKLIDTKPEDKVDFHLKKIESDLGQMAKDGKLDLNDPNVRTSLDRAAQLNGGRLPAGLQGAVDNAKQASTESARLTTYRNERQVDLDTASQSIQQSISDKEMALGRKLTEDEKKQVLGMGGGLQHFSPAMKGSNLPVDAKDIAGKPIDPVQSYKEQTDSKGNHVGYVAVEVGSQAPKIESLALDANGKPTANPHRWKIYPDDTPAKPHREYVGPIAVSASYRENEEGKTVALPKYVAPRGSAAAPGAPPGRLPASVQSMPVPPGQSATRPGVVEKAAKESPATTKKLAAADPGIDMAAWDYITDDKLPGGSGKAGMGMKKKVMARAGQILEDLGVQPYELRGMRAQLKANSSALTKLTWTGAAIGQFEKTLRNNIDYAKELNKDFSRSNVKFANHLQAFLRGEASDPKVVKFMAQMETVSQEWAKIMQGSTSVAGAAVKNSTDAKAIMNPYLSRGATDELFGLIERDISNRTTAIDAQQKDLLDKIKGVIPTPSDSKKGAVPRGTDAPPAPPPGSAPKKFEKAEDYLKHIGVHP